MKGLRISHYEIHRNFKECDECRDEIIARSQMTPEEIVAKLRDLMIPEELIAKI